MLFLKLEVLDDNLFVQSLGNLTTCKKLGVKLKYDLAGVMLIVKKEAIKYSEVKNNIITKYDTSPDKGSPSIDPNLCSREEYNNFKKEMNEAKEIEFGIPLNDKLKLDESVVKELTALDLCNLDSILVSENKNEEENSN